MDTSARNQPISTRHGLAFIVIAGSVLFPSLAQFQLGSSLFGEHPVEKLLCIAAVGGAISGALFGGRRWWLIGSIAGLVAAVGAAGAVPLYVAWLHKEKLWKGELILVLGAGAMPGLMLGAFLSRFGKCQKEKDEDA